MEFYYDEIKAKFPAIRDIRNMQAHDIDYYKNRGNKQKEFIKENEEESFIVDATSTIITNSGYLIGGRIDVIEVLEYFSGIENKILDKF